MKTTRAVDLSAVAFSTDLTPSLYALLGHEPRDRGSLFGRPLFVSAGTNMSWRRRRSFLLASSYGAVYATLRQNGRRMYVVNENGWLNVIHLGSGLIRTIPIDGAPCSLSLTPDDAVLYIGLVFEGCVLTMDAHSLQITGRLDTGGKPRRIAFAPSGKTAVIANELGWIDVVH